MSGGLYEYKDGSLCNEMFGEYRPEINHYRESSNGDPMEDIEMSCLVYDVLALIHSLDWYKCGDTSQKDYRKDLRAFKKKWLDPENRSKNLEKMVKEMCDENYRKCMSLLGK